MFKIGDKVVYQWDSNKHFGLDGYNGYYGPGYSNLKEGEILTVDYVFGDDNRFFETIEYGSGDAFLEKYFITLKEYRRNKLNKLNHDKSR